MSFVLNPDISEKPLRLMVQCALLAFEKNKKKKNSDLLVVRLTIQSDLWSVKYIRYSFCVLWKLKM